MKDNKIRFAMLVSPTEERQKNALKIKEQIPELELVHANYKEKDLFTTHLETLRTDSKEYSGVVMMEDDAILCENFRKRFDNVIKDHGSDMIQFFEKPMAKTMPKRGFAKGSEFFSAVCYYMPSEFTDVFCSDYWVKRFKEYYPTLKQPWNYPIDTYIQYVLKNNKMIYWREVPFLVQHSLLKSNFKGRAINRQTKFFIDDLEKK